MQSDPEDTEMTDLSSPVEDLLREPKEYKPFIMRIKADYELFLLEREVQNLRSIVDFIHGRGRGNVPPVLQPLFFSTSGDQAQVKEPQELLQFAENGLAYFLSNACSPSARLLAFFPSQDV